MKRAWGGSDVGRILRDWADRCSDKAQSFLLQNLSQGRFCTNSWPTRDSAALSGQQALSARSTVAFGDAWLEVLDYEGNVMSPAEVERQRERDHGGSLGREGQGVPFL